MRRRPARRAEGGAGRRGPPSAPPLRARNRAAAIGARGGVEAVYRRPRHAGQAASRAGRGDVQSHLLFHRPGGAARHRVRIRPAHGGTPQHALPHSHRQQDSRHLPAPAARIADAGAHRRQGGPGGGAGPGDARVPAAPSTRRAIPPGRTATVTAGHRPGRAAHCLHDGPGGEGSVRPGIRWLLPEPGGANEEFMESRRSP